MEREIFSSLQIDSTCKKKSKNSMKQTKLLELPNKYIIARYNVKIEKLIRPYTNSDLSKIS